MPYTYTREQAAELLEISTRTLDRYVKRGRLRSKRRWKKIFIHEDDVRSLQNAEPELARPTDRETDSIVFFEDGTDTGFTRRPSVVDYRDLYEDAMQRIAEKDRVIQDLSYRTWHAESELKNSISMIEYKKATFLLESAKAKTEEEKHQFENEIVTLKTEISSSRFVFYTLVSLVVVLMVVCAILAISTL